MYKKIGFAISLIFALIWTETAFAQTSASIPPPALFTRINFVPGTNSYTITTNLASGISQGYVLGISAQQSLYLTKTGNANVEAFDPIGNIFVTPATDAGPRGAAAARSGDYTLILYGQGPVTVSIYVPQGSFPQAYSTIVPSFQPRIHFAPGADNYSFSEFFQQGMPLAFLLGISGGQQLSIWTQGNLTAAVLDLDGSPRPAASSQYGQWEYSIPVTGDYTLVLSGAGSGWISITIPPLGASAAASGPIRIRFLPGDASLTTFANEQAGYPVPQYLLGISAGQSLYIATTGNVSSVQVFDPFDNPVPAFAQPNGSLSFSIGRTGDYRVVVYGSGSINITFYIPPFWWW